MRYHLYFAQGQFRDFKVRLLELNRYLKYFPVLENKKTVTCLPDNKLIEIIDKAKPVPYQQALLTSNYDPYCKSMEEYSQYLEKLEASAKIDKVLTKSSQAETTKKSAKNAKRTKKKNQQKNQKSKNAKFASARDIPVKTVMKIQKMLAKYQDGTKATKPKQLLSRKRSPFLLSNSTIWSTISPCLEKLPKG